MPGARDGSDHSGDSAAILRRTHAIENQDDGVVRVWDEVSGKVVLSLAGHRFGVTDAQWSPDGTRILTGSEDGTARLWDATTGEMTGLFLCFLPDGGVAILDAPSLSLRSGPAEVWDYLGRPEILAGQLTRVGVERRQYIDPNPVRDVAGEFHELCDAETQAISRLVGVPVQRLATLAGGEHVCTTHIPIAMPALRKRAVRAAAKTRGLETKRMEGTR